ncbi:GNAT family N-acetyltransferase [Kribbella antibiotica]|uniref:GNAT family N-acetyltransferase n=1 Tax=Kribbella antibiotica TaxID=190195 RepID=A0A4R4ZKH4_9ACTN|nr:GNAT family N-acetyltransferase [Kribbella antibiotica]TDD59055.1 GNAT family N-acetyltransferase [Kribbella antibiotica]
MYDVVVPMTIRGLTVDDLPTLGESPSKLVSMEIELQRAERGEVDYLAVCTPNGQPVGYGAVDFLKPPGGATLYQLTVLEQFQSCGIGTILIQALEQSIRARGIAFAELGIDDASPRPRALYERLGYVVSGTELGSWQIDTPAGPARYETTITLFRKPLGPPAPEWATTALPREIVRLLESPRTLAELSDVLGVTDARILWYLTKLAAADRVRETDGRWIRTQQGATDLATPPPTTDLLGSTTYDYQQAFADTAAGMFGTTYVQASGEHGGRVPYAQAVEFNQRLQALTAEYFAPDRIDRTASPKYGFHWVLTPTDLHPLA